MAVVMVKYGLLGLALLALTVMDRGFLALVLGLALMGSLLLRR